MKTTLLLFIFTTFMFAKTNPLDMTLAEAKASCHKKKSVGCQSLALKYYNGDGVKINDKKAHEYTVKACKYGSKNACFNYGYQLELGRGVVKNKKEAFKYYEKACDWAKKDGTYKNEFNKCRALKIRKSKLSSRELLKIYGESRK